MRNENAATIVRTSGHPVLRFLTSFPIALFSGALLTDLAYLRTADMMWADFSAWLLAVGIVIGVLAALVGLVLLATSRAARAHRPLWPLVIGSVVVLVLALFDNFIHSRDGWTSVVPLGLILSAATFIIMLITLWLGTDRRDWRVVPAEYVGPRP